MVVFHLCFSAGHATTRPPRPSVRAANVRYDHHVCAIPRASLELPMPLTPSLRLGLTTLVIALIPVAAPHAGAAAERDAALARLSAASQTGVIYDRVLPLARLDELDGTAGGPIVTLARWRQGYDELRRASGVPAG